MLCARATSPSGGPFCLKVLKYEENLVRKSSPSLCLADEVCQKFVAENSTRKFSRSVPPSKNVDILVHQHTTDPRILIRFEIENYFPLYYRNTDNQFPP